jgi:hypothetical protein
MLQYLRSPMAEFSAKALTANYVVEPQAALQPPTEDDDCDLQAIHTSRSK